MGNPTGGETDDFSPRSTQATFEAACHKVGFDPAGAILIRLGENALYRLAGEPVVVRIARTMEYWHQVQKEVSVSNWLADIEYPAARLIDLRTQPIDVNGHPVTFWRFIDGTVAMPEDVSELAHLLRRFHRLSKPQQFELPRVKFADRVARRLETAPAPD